MADLRQPGALALADVGGALSEELEVGSDLLVGVGGPGDDDRQQPGVDDLRVAAHRGGEQGDIALGELAAHLRRCLGRDGGRVDDDPRARARGGEQARRADDDLLEVLGAGDHGEDDVAVGKLNRRVDDARPELGQRLGLGPRAVVDRDVASRLDQAAGQAVAHPASADPTEPPPPDRRPASKSP